MGNDTAWRASCLIHSSHQPCNPTSRDPVSRLALLILSFLLFTRSLPRLPLFSAYSTIQAEGPPRTVSGAAHLFAKIRFDFDFRANEHIPFGRFLENGGRTVSWPLANEAAEVPFSTDTPSLTFCR